MNAERQRILEMVAAGQITPSDAENLLQAVRKPRPSVSKWLFQPLELLETRTALLLAGVAAFGGLLLSLRQVRFDGALDLHATTAPVAFSQAAIDLVLAWPLTALVFWAVARVVARQGRFVDLLAAVGVARIPYVFAGALLATLAPRTSPGTVGDIDAATIAMGIATLPLLGWFIALLVTGFRTASGLRGGRLALASVLAIVAAEIVSKLLLLAL